MSLPILIQSTQEPPKPTLATYRDLLFKYLRPQWFITLLMVLLLFISIALQLVNPLLLRSFIDAATSGANTPSLVFTGLLFVGISLVNQGISVWAVYLSENVAWTATNAMRIDLVAHCLKLDMAFHKAHTSGEMIERIDGDVNTLATFFSQSVVYLLGNTLLILGIVVLLFVADWRIGIVMGTFTLIAFAILYRLREFAVPAWEQNRAKSAEFFGFIGEQLAGTADTRANGATGYVMNKFYQLLRSWYPINRRAGLSGYAMVMATIGVFGIGNALVFAVGAYLWSIHAITLGTVYLVFYYTNLLEQPMQQIRMQLQQLQQAAAGIERIQRLLLTPTHISDGGNMSLPSGALSVDFEHVSFGYDALDAQDTDNMILHDISFHLQPGKVLGVLGRTGSGKTTLARLILRLYDIQSGQIRLGDVPVNQTHLRELRQHIGMVMQDVQLFNASVRDNLTFFNPTIPDERIVSVLDDLGLAHWLHALPEGLDTVLGSDGEGLSAGEAQLLAFTRVFLSNPGLVILDEASSRLDPATEQLIERAISKLFVERTAIVIAHRLGTVQRADEILVMEDGRIVEYGERMALAANPQSHFASLLQTSLEGVRA
ncbi:MAG TPA: ABC transporter ATP-binding protein [Ktedonobacter sp.]|nr:ABC transporter ATP-binding protein [Ktedonobacter sp.]